jgi:hypothetical protein
MSYRLSPASLVPNKFIAKPGWRSVSARGDGCWGEFAQAADFQLSRTDHVISLALVTLKGIYFIGSE